MEMHLRRRQLPLRLSRMLRQIWVLREETACWWLRSLWLGCSYCEGTSVARDPCDSLDDNPPEDLWDRGDSQ